MKLLSIPTKNVSVEASLLENNEIHNMGGGDVKICWLLKS